MPRVEKDRAHLDDGQEMQLYVGDGGIRVVKFDAPRGVPLKVGSTFQCKVTAISHEVVDRG